MTYNPELEAAHDACSCNYEQLQASETCGCCFCLAIFSPQEITKWIDDTDGKTAVCPKCGVDVVIGSQSQLPVTKEFLTEMYNYWFPLRQSAE